MRFSKRKLHVLFSFFVGDLEEKKEKKKMEKAKNKKKKL